MERAIEGASPLDWSRTTGSEGARDSLQILIEDGDGQKLLDALQAVLTLEDQWRLTVMDVEATLPRIEEAPADEAGSGEERKEKKQAMREAIVDEVMGNSRLDTDFIVLTVLSALVAAIGLNEDNVAVVIGAMVIAPLLGPVLGFSLGSALGSAKMMWTSARTAVTGLAVGFGTAFLLSLIFPVHLESSELLARRDLSPEIVALALASGAAAALSITGGISSALVGVMVAVALLPPSVAAAIFLGAGDVGSALAAGLVVALNITCVLISTQIVFVWKGVQPRRWLQQKSASRSRRISMGLGALLLILLSILAFWIGA